MPTEIRLWRIEGEHPTLVEQQKLDLEVRIENWIKHDVALINNDLLIIGQQVPTGYGGFIDLLSIDPVGNLVILELKKDKTSRETVAQVLDYASMGRETGTRPNPGHRRRFPEAEDVRTGISREVQCRLARGSERAAQDVCRSFVSRLRNGENRQVLIRIA